MIVTQTYPLVGGFIIGLSVSLLMISVGKICGLSGIFSGMLLNFSDRWRWVFFFGFATGCIVIRFIGTDLIQQTQYAMSLPLAVISGLLVGLGTRLGGGCTSGHGICGVSRLSKRSVIATALFMGVAILTVFIRKNLL